MKKLISNNGGFKTFAEIRNCINPDNLVQLRFFTEYEAARHPEEPRILCEMMLTPDERAALKEFL